VAPVQPGLAAPDGRIFLTRGFYEKFNRLLSPPKELASVIAHGSWTRRLGAIFTAADDDFSGQNGHACWRLA